MKDGLKLFNEDGELDISSRRKSMSKGPGAGRSLAQRGNRRRLMWPERDGRGGIGTIAGSSGPVSP